MKRNTGFHRFLLPALAVMLAGAVEARAVVITDVSLPSRHLPGDRSATAKVDLEGKHRRDVSVWVYYSDTRNNLTNINDNLPHARASCKSSSNGLLTCTFIFPHTVHDRPNILSTTEINGGEPPEVRPTFIDVAATPLGVERFVITDERALKISAPKTAYCRWVVKVKSGASTQTITDEIREFSMPRRLVIASLGDSYASGEGAPNIEGVTLEQRWDDEPCHRSSRSGQVRAVKQFRTGHPEVAVAFFNAACSGAEIDKGLLNPQEEYAVSGNVKPGQLKALQDWMAAENRPKVDVLLMSIGGNNAGFADAGISCLLALLGDCRNDEDLWQRLGQRIASLPDAYSDLAGRLESFNIGEVLITEYPDPTKASNGKLCNSSGNPDPGLCWGPVERAVSVQDFRRIHDDLLVKLNQAVRAAAQAHDWTYVGGTVDAALRHGLCNCDDPYFNTPGQAMFVQGDIRGSLHPNREGHRRIYQPLVAKALDDQYKKIRIAAAKAVAKQKMANRQTDPDPGPFVLKVPVLPPKKVLPTTRKLFDTGGSGKKLEIQPRKVTLGRDDDLDRLRIAEDTDGR